LNVSSFYQDVVKGVVILFAVLIDRKRWLHKELL
jgi:predicted ABC-type sugar transport system permease subunit